MTDWVGVSDRVSTCVIEWALTLFSNRSRKKISESAEGSKVNEAKGSKVNEVSEHAPCLQFHHV